MPVPYPSSLDPFPAHEGWLTDYLSQHPSGGWSVRNNYIPPNEKKIYFKCESCGAKYVLPEMTGTNLIRLVCSGCGGNLEEVQK
jgi:hypothetical protein